MRFGRGPTGEVCLPACPRFVHGGIPRLTGEKLSALYVGKGRCQGNCSVIMTKYFFKRWQRVLRSGRLSAGEFRGASLGPWASGSSRNDKPDGSGVVSCKKIRLFKTCERTSRVRAARSRIRLRAAEPSVRRTRVMGCGVTQPFTFRWPSFSAMNFLISSAMPSSFSHCSL